ncbi:putative RNA-directed DNA polymerase from transposon BS [Trichonephila clavipes]|nr:putative RNA-directed DNA polymerase from transposon BS [Trichonephila clavipes]
MASLQMMTELLLISLGSNYQKMSRLTFNKADKNTKLQAKLAVHKCRNSDLSEPVFLADFSMHELLLVLNVLDPKKSPGPYKINGVMITHLGSRGTQRLLDVIKQSRKSGRLSHEWKKTTIPLPIRKPSKVFSSPKSYQPVALTSIPCKTMKRMMPRRLTYFLDRDNLLPQEQYGFSTSTNCSVVVINIEPLNTLSIGKIIKGIPLDAAKVYTDGSKGETNTTGSGVLIELPGHVIKLQKRNADHASVFRTELISTMCGLSFINNIGDLAVSEFWILRDSRSSIQHLLNWPSIGDTTSRSIFSLFQQLLDRHSIYLQWVPSHVGLLGNEVADNLAKAASSNPVDPENHMVLTSTEIYSRVKELICRTWVVTPVHS